MPNKTTIYQVKCRLCDEKLQDLDKTKLQSKLKIHIDNDCVVAKEMRDWEKQGIYEEMMEMLKLQGLEEDLKKLLKYYSKQEIEEVLNNIEGEKLV